MPKYFEFEVCLQHIQPLIWRRLVVRRTFNFAQLHKALQAAFGWHNSHLWEFRLPGIRGRPIAGAVFNEEDGRPVPDARTVKLTDYFSGVHSVEWCEYVYDFGDGWTHEVKLVGVHTSVAAFKQRLLEGRRSGPPEDCGGPPGYDRMVQFVETGEDPWDDHERLATWLGTWRPDNFSLEAAKAAFDC